MACRRCGFLFYEYFAADRAGLAFGKAGFGAGRGLSGIDQFGMSRGRQLFLIDEYFVAHRAMFTFGQTCFCASGCLRRIDDFGVTLSRDRPGAFFSAGTFLFFEAVFGAGRLINGAPLAEKMGVFRFFRYIRCIAAAVRDLVT